MININYENFTEFINEGTQKETADIENVLWENYADLKIFDMYLRSELNKQGFGPLNIRHDDYQSKMSENGNINLAFTTELGNRILEETKLDIPDYFIKLKEFFIPYGYIKTVKGDSTSYYNIMVDYNTLLESELFWENVFETSIEKNKRRKNKKRKLKEHEIVKYPDWFVKKHQNYFDSTDSIEKFDL